MKGCAVFEGGDQAPKQVKVVKADDGSSNGPCYVHRYERYSSFVNTPRFKANKPSCPQKSTLLSHNSDSNLTNTFDLCDVFVGEDYNLEKPQTGPRKEKAPEKGDESARENEPEKEKSAGLLVAVLDSKNSDLEEKAPTPEDEVKHNPRVTVESTSRLSEGNIKIARVVTGIVIVVLFGVYFTRFLMNTNGSWFH